MVKLAFITPSAADIIAYAARFSTATQEENLERQQEKDNGKLVSKLIKKGHFSCLEFADAMFEIECSRACLAQITRHRLFSFCCRSQRYVSENGFDYITPRSVIKEVMLDDYEALMNDLDRWYRRLISAGVPKEDARYILPNACKTRLVMKGNFRSWIEFLQKRLEKQAQWEIRGIAEEIRDILIEECPVVFENVNFDEVKI